MIEDGTRKPFLTDFGVAAVLESASEEVVRLTQAGELIGDPRYASPEQMEAGPVTDRTDIYSLGVMGLQLLTGEAPRLIGPSRSGGAPAAEGVDDPALVDLLHRCMAEEPSHRPTAAELIPLLASSGGEVEAAPSLLQRLKERRMVQWTIGVGLFGLGAIELVDQLVGNAMLPPVAFLLAIVTVFWGLVATMVVAWFHGEKGRQEVGTLERWLLGVVVVGWVLTVWGVVG
jgi:hypothetical protein